METTHDQTDTTALLIGGPYDNRIARMHGHPAVFHVQTFTKTYNPNSAPLGHYEVEPTAHEYWRIPGEGNQHLYLYAKNGELPKRLTYSYVARSLDFIGTIVHDAISQIVEEGGDERTVTATISLGRIGSDVTYTVTAEAFRATAYTEEQP